MTSESILVLFLIFFALEFGWETFLAALNIRNVRANRDRIPPVFRGVIDRETYQKSVDYSIVKEKFGVVASLASSLFLLWLILSGGFGAIDERIAEFGFEKYSHGVIFVFVVTLIFSAVLLPFSVYSQFFIEEKFGFNKMTWSLFLLDQIKGMILSAILFTPLLFALFWFMDATGEFWWVYAFIFITVFQLLMMVLYPKVIAPIFNKFSPLEEGDLKQDILAVAKKCAFDVNGVFVMDGSKRSRHSNAYFTGLGKSKRIVLFDTLINALDREQVVSVLAHEIGHEKKKHIKKQLVLTSAGMLTGLFILSLLLEFTPFFQAFGFEAPSYHAAVVLFSFCAGPFTFFLSPLSSILSRKYEYEADRFAAEAMQSAEGLRGALLKLGKDNLSNFTPHPWYSFYHYSHPTLAERLEAMDKIDLSQ